MESEQEAREPDPVLRVPAAKIALSTASTYPETTATAFEMAARLGYDGVEVMVWTDPVSQDVDALRAAVGATTTCRSSPCTRPACSSPSGYGARDPWGKLQRAEEAAERLGAETVVVHPPFRWQREYAREFVERPRPHAG